MPHAHLLPRKTCSHSPVYFPASKSLRRAACLGLGLLSLLSLSAGHAALAGTVNWDGTANDWFASPSHWSNGSTPGAGDDAVNMSTAAMTLGQSTTINSFFSNGAFTLQGGTFSGNQAGSTLTVNNVFTVNGGGISNFTVRQGQGGSFVLGSSGGNFLDNTIIGSSVDMATSPSAFVRLYDTNTFNGAITLGSTGTIDLRDGNTNMVIGTAGSLAGAGAVTQDYGGATLTNNGTINANVGGQTLSINNSTLNSSAGSVLEASGGGVLSLAGNITSAASILASGGAVDISGTFTGTGGTVMASNGGAVNIQGAALLGTISTGANTALILSSSGANSLNNTAINGNLDLATQTSAFLRAYNADTVNGAITLGPTGTLDLRDGNTSFTIGSGGSLVGAGTVSEDYGGSTLTNNGTVNANVSGQTLNQVNTSFVNNGTAEATSGGTLSFSNNITNTGLLAANSGGIVNLSGTFTSSLGNSINGVGGTINVNGANLLGTINETAGTNLVFSSSGANSLNNTTVNGNLNLSTQGSAFLRLYNADTVNGAITLGPAGTLDLRDGNTSLTIGSGGSLAGAGTVSEDYGGSTFTSNGTINANAAGGTLNQINTSFVNNGTAEATNGGILALSNNITNNGALNAVGAGSLVTLAGTFTGSGSGLITASGGGQVQANGVNLLGTINEAAGTSLILSSSGANNLNNTAINGNLNLSTQGSAFLRLYNTDTVSGAISMGSTGILDLRDGNTSFTIGSGGSLVGSGTVSEDYGGSTLTNNGTVNANVSGQTLNQVNTSFVNNGTAEATSGGTLSLSNNITNNGALNAVGAGSLVTLAGTFTGAGSSLITASNGGQVQANGVNLLGTINTDANTALVVSGSGANSLNNTVVNGNLDLATQPSAFLRAYNADTVNGAITLGPTGTLDLRDGNTSLTIGSGGSLAGAGAVTQDYGGAAFTNSGTVNANVSGQTLNINTSAFNNAGTTAVQQGAALNVTSTNTDSGNILVAKGGTATFTQGVTQTAGLTQVNGTLNSPLSLSGGTLSGSGTVNGDVANSGGTVAAGSPFGTLAVNGAFSQASGTLDAVFSSTQSNLLLVSGAVTTGGTLSVSYLGSGAYTGFTPFTFLDYGSLGTEPTNALGLTQYFSNETPLTNTTGLITGQNGFTYELFNNTGLDAFQLQVLTNGAPVPEASTNLSLGALLALGGLGVWRAKRRPVNASPGHAAE